MSRPLVASEAPFPLQTQPIRAGDRQPPCILHVFPSFAVGGVPNRIATVISRLGSRFRHKIVALDGRTEASLTLARTAPVELLAHRPNESGWVGEIRSVRSILGAEKPEVLATYNWGAMDWAFTNTMFSYCAHIHFESGFGKEEALRQFRRRILFRRVALARCARLVVPSHTLAAIARDLWRVPRHKLQIIANGVDTDLFTGDPGVATHAEFRQSPNQRVIGTVSPLRPEKNLVRLLRAVADLEPGLDVRVVLVGEGAERPRLEAAAREYGLAERTVFTGCRSDIDHVLRGFDVFAMTSDTEQMPNSLLQAMAAGRPVVATDVGDIKRLVALENRPFVVAADDRGALVGSLAALLEDPQQRVVLGRCNQDRARRDYGLDRMVESYDALFNGASRSRAMPVHAHGQ